MASYLLFSFSQLLSIDLEVAQLGTALVQRDGSADSGHVVIM